VGGDPGGPPNRKQHREFVWNYGAPDSVGEKRERVEAFRGRETVRRDWGHDDDEGDFQRDRHIGNRRHRSLSGWARSSRCRGGMDDCYRSNDKHRHSTPFHRHGLGMTPSSRWVPKAKVKTVSFADPIISAIWPQVDSLVLTDGVGSKSGSIGVDNQETSHDPAASKCKVTNTVDLTNVFATIHNSLDSVLACSPSVNLNTSIPAKALAVQPIEFLGSQLVNDNQAIDHNMPAADRVGLMGASIIHDLPGLVFQPVDNDNQPDFQPVDSDNHETLRASPALRTGNSSADNTQFFDFIAAITNPPEPPLIPSPPKSSTTTSHPLKFQNQPTTRRSSVRLAAKKCIKTGSNRDAISKA
jgi:hypothetical protein